MLTQRPPNVNHCPPDWQAELFWVACATWEETARQYALTSWVSGARIG